MLDQMIFRPEGGEYDDFLRRLLPTTDYTFVNGDLCINARGLVRLCDAVLSDRVAGDKPNAAFMRAAILEEFPEAKIQQ
jgi:hypothetical protein